MRGSGSRDSSSNLLRATLLQVMFLQDSVVLTCVLPVLPDKAWYLEEISAKPFRAKNFWAGKLSTGKFFDFSTFEPEKIRQNSFRPEKKVSVIYPIIG